MLMEINLPDIGEDEVEIIEILVKEGDKIAVEQSLITVEGDKASIEIPAPFAGIVQKIKVKVGDKVSTGSLIMICVSEDTMIKSIPISTSDNQVILEGNKNHKNTESQPIIVNKEIYSKPIIENNIETYVHATPTIRRLARKFNLNLTKIKGTGRKGRILRADILSYIREAIKHLESTTQNVSAVTRVPYVQSGLSSWPRTDFSKFGEIEEVDIGRIRKISGANLSRNWTMIPHITLFDKIDITELENFRKKQNTEAKLMQSNIKITPIIFVMKAVAATLKRMPYFNSSLSEDGKHIILKKYINIGIAVDTPNGLVVPVIQDVNKKSITDLSKELMNLTEKARNNKLTANEIQGGCFTISSIGNLGTTYFAPIVNAPEVAILGISKISIEPVWDGREFLPRSILPISISLDHRVIDGADGARFVTIINSILSDIRLLIM